MFFYLIEIFYPFFELFKSFPQSCVFLISLWPSDVCSKSIEAHQGKVKNQTSSKTPPKPGFALEADDYKNLGALTEHLLADDFEHLWNNLVNHLFNQSRFSMNEEEEA